jgi:hypothetical protein
MLVWPDWVAPAWRAPHVHVLDYLRVSI